MDMNNIKVATELMVEICVMPKN